jgi:Protein of unknown function (DUF2815)
MTDNVITPEFRAGYVGLFRASAPKDEPDGKKKFSIRAFFPSNADLSTLREQAKQAVKEKWGDKTPSALRSPFRTNGDLDNPVDGIPKDWVVMTFSANEDRRPGVVDENLQDIIDETQCYSGAWFRAQVRAFAYEARGNKGVSFGLQNVQKVRDDDPIGAGRIPASKAFDKIETPAGAGAGKSGADIFG